MILGGPPRLRDRRAAVALWAAVTAPVMLTAVSVGVEISAWALARVELQNIADIAADAGALIYASTGNAQTATTAAVDTAEVNGIVGQSTRGWNATTYTTSDNMATATYLASSPVTSTNPAIVVTVRRAVPLYFARIFQSLTSVTVAATAVAEISSGEQSCLVALSATGTSINVTNGVALRPENCAIRANASITVSGGSSIVATDIYAGGTITATNGSSYTPNPGNPSAGTIGDPLASNTALQTLLASSGNCNMSNCSPNNTSGAVTLYPGTYNTLNFTGYGAVTLSAGLYVVNGAVSFTGGGTSVTGTGVTIVSTGMTVGNDGLTVTNGVSVTLTAPGLSPTNGAISGVVFASNASGSTFNFAGGTTTTLTGLVYAPNAQFNFNNAATFGTTTNQSSSGNDSTDCLEVIASTITLAANARLSTANCRKMGASPTSPVAPTASAQLVE